MSRHRNVRNANYADDYDGYDDVYGHSVEDDHFCTSPGTAAQFTYNRENQHVLSSYMDRHQNDENIPEEDEIQDDHDPLHDSGSYQRPKLNDTDNARLNSCLEQMRSILGDTTPEHVLVEAVLKYDFNFERALDFVLSQQTDSVADAPKPQREPRQNRRSRSENKPSQNGKQQDFKLTLDIEKAAPNVQTSREAVFEGPVSGVARLTFATGKPAQTGFVGSDQPSASSTAQKADKEQQNGQSSPSKATGKADKQNNKPSPSRSSKESQNDRLKAEKPSSRDVSPVPSSSAASGPAPAATRSPYIPRTPSRQKIDKKDAKKEYEKRKADGTKQLLNLVVVGHVDAGKSTLMGHLLFQLGFVNKKTMHKYEQEAKKIGKASFAYAWVLDETEEERSRGVTMDVAQTRFETTSKCVTLLDAPGHKDFIPNMITGAAQADVAILVVNATRGEFETGFEAGGQTREHAMLIRSLGVSQLIVAINKMDTVDWAQTRFEEITKKLGAFLKQAGFRPSDISYIPCSGLSGENLTKRSTEPKLEWYKGSTIIDQIDQLNPPERPVDKPFRLCVGDVFKGMGSGISVTGTIHAGTLQVGERVIIMPQGEPAAVKTIQIDESPSQYGFAGDNVTITLTGIDPTNIGVGSILCDTSSQIRAASRLRARVVVFNIDIPLTKGFPVVLHYQSISEPAYIRKLISQLHKSTGEVVKKKPRCLTKNTNAVIEVELERPICVELYKDYKDLGRFMLRYGGKTIAAGLVTEILEGKTAKND